LQSTDALQVGSLGVGRHRIDLTLDALHLVPGTYSLRVGVALGDYFQAVYYAENLHPIKVIAPSANLACENHGDEGFIRFSGQWTLVT
jgi:hypothetical protein